MKVNKDVLLEYELFPSIVTLEIYNMKRKHVDSIQ